MLDPEVKAAVDELVLGLVVQVQAEARKYFRKAPHALELRELEGVGNVALVWASANWENYCTRNGFSPAAVQYFRAYALRRIRGAILDHLRGQDWVSRSVRGRYKLIQEVPEGASEVLIQERTGLGQSVIRETRAAVARRPVSLDERTEDIPGPEGVEAQAVTGGVLRAIATSRELLSVQARAVLALKFYCGLSLPDIAEELQLPLDEVQSLHDIGVLVIHQAMLGEVA